MATASSNQGAREVYGAVTASPGTPAASTPSAPATVSVGTGGSDTAAAASATRSGLILTNTSTGGQRISLHLTGGTAVLDSGITLWPQDTWEMDAQSFTTSAITAISSAASGALGRQEFTR